MSRPISHELTFVYITSDGSKFLHKEDAEFHQEYLESLGSEES
jgi:hypothetical protein